MNYSNRSAHSAGPFRSSWSLIAYCLVLFVDFFHVCNTRCRCTVACGSCPVHSPDFCASGVVWCCYGLVRCAHCTFQRCELNTRGVVPTVVCEAYYISVVQSALWRDLRRRAEHLLLRSFAMYAIFP